MPNSAPRIVRAIAATILALAFLIALPAHAAGERDGELAQMARAWLKLSDFQTVISAFEFDGKHADYRTFRYSFLRPNHAKIEMLDGPSRGFVVVWNGGDRVVAYRRGALAVFRMTFGIHDKNVTSMRGNTILRPDLGSTLRCFETKIDRVQQAEGPVVDGESTIALVLEDKNPLRCSGDSSADLPVVTKDMLFLNRELHLPVRRARFAGDMQVEGWQLENLRVDVGLTPKDFN